MTATYIADTGVFVRCGGPKRPKYRALRRALRQADVTLLVPKLVYEELGGDPASAEYSRENMLHASGFEEGWIDVAEDLEYANSLVSSAMDDARRFIANETGRAEDTIEKADTALVGLAAQLLGSGDAETVVLLTTDKPAGRAAERVLDSYGYGGRIEYRYVSESFLESITAAEFV